MRRLPHLSALRGFILLIAALAFLAGPADAACHVVTPAGSGAKTGADWNNAYAGLPSTLTRGDTYYLADGVYPSYTFNTPTSGTETIEIRKAQAAPEASDHCTDTGWNASTMGSGQAIFRYNGSEPIIGLNTSYITLNGNGSQQAPGCGNGGAAGTTRSQAPPNPQDCGIKIDNSACTSTASNACNSPIRSMNANITHLTLSYVETMGNNNNLSEEMVIFQPYSGDGYGNFAHLFAHNTGCVYIQDGQANESVTSSYFWGTISNSSGCHGQASFDTGSDSNTTYASNVFRDIQGTAIWTFAMGVNGTHSNWKFYNNVIWGDAPLAAQLDNGIIACINSGQVCSNFMLVQNTVSNVNYNGGAIFENPGGSLTVYNNLWYQNKDWNGNPGGVSFAMGGSTLTEDYNSLLQSGTNPLTGGHDKSDPTSPNPFVNASAGNFNLASQNAAWQNRTNLNAPFTTDINGNLFIAAVGAYELRPASVAPTLSGTAK